MVDLKLLLRAPLAPFQNRDMDHMTIQLLTLQFLVDYNYTRNSSYAVWLLSDSCSKLL